MKSEIEKTGRNDMLLNQEPITNICEYTELINNILVQKNWFKASTMPWYRGQDEFSWKLIPSIYRDGLYKYEREILRDFKLSSHILTKREFFGIDDEIEWTFLMQHYGLPTRLLDWTESSLIALYFSVRNYKNTQDAVVWVLDSWSLNRQPETYNMYSIPDETSPFLQNYILPPSYLVKRNIVAENPIALRAKKNNARILAQKGQFTIHGFDSIALDDFAKNINKSATRPIYFKKIKIDGKYKLNILKELYVSGISDSLVFAEITGICSEIKFRHSSDFR